MKRLTALVLTMIISISLAGCGSLDTYAQEGSVPSVTPDSQDIQVILNGSVLTFDVSPRSQNGRVLVPLRAIFEAMGADITYDAATSTVTATKGETTVILTLGSNSPTVNGQIVPIDEPGVAVDGRTLAPLRFVAEAFGGQVSWDGAANTATITTNTETEVSEVAPSPSVTYKYEGPAYEIVVVQENGIADMYWVLTDKLDYSTKAYRDIVKAIITDVVYNANTDALNVLVVTDEDIIELETNLNSPEEHGQEWYYNTLAVEETDWIAWYTGGIDVNNERSDDESAFEIAWLLSTDIDPDSQSMELWRPELNQ